MKISKQKNRSTKSRAIIIIVCVIAALLIAGAVYVIGFKGSLFGWQPFGSSSSLQDTTTQNSDDTSHGTKDGSNAPTTDKTTNQIPVDDALVATFTDLSQSGGYVKFSGSVDNSKGGSCSIFFTNPNDRPISRTVDATQDGNKAICGPIQIPETEFSFLGEWTATFRYYVNDTQVVAERKLMIQ